MVDDVARPKDVDKVFRYARQAFGRLDVLVANAVSPATGSPRCRRRIGAMWLRLT
jgi:NAD(P)-dependent dehydrogenase (short-subunit alcohol dehydrogenase family)